MTPDRFANEPAAQLRQQPGFCDTPQGFHVDAHELDEVSGWKGGYSTHLYDDDASD